MLDRSLPLFGQDSLDTLPTPKMSPKDRVGVHRWYKEYAAFSEGFAVSALEILVQDKTDIIFDPFLGSGTSLVAAKKNNLRFIGAELSPFSTLLSRTKIAYNSDESVVFNMLEGATDYEQEYSTELIDTFSQTDLIYASRVVAKLMETTQARGGNLLENLINNSEKQWDSYRVALLALILSAREVSTLSQGSNPVWFRKGQNKQINSEALPLSKVAKRIATVMLDNLKNEAAYKDSYDIDIYCGDAKRTPFGTNSFDVFLTSPPYLNRLDYVVNQLPEILLFSLVEQQDLDSMKRKMVGTTKIVEKGEPRKEWGSTCLQILEKIRTHQSRASNTYYIWNYYKYFKDMYEIFEELKRLARKNARGALVVQNSHYKEIPIPVTKIFSEMGENLNISISEVKHVKVKSHMGLLSPKQREYTANKILKESVLFFHFNQ